MSLMQQLRNPQQQKPSSALDVEEVFDQEESVDAEYP
jgi:hypothetical protein